jgi:hypothetical protein
VLVRLRREDVDGRKSRHGSRWESMRDGSRFRLLMSRERRSSLVRVGRMRQVGSVRGSRFLNASGSCDFTIHSFLSAVFVFVLVVGKGRRAILGSKVGSDWSERLSFLEIKRRH